jgi:hypothetical protein
MLEGLLFGTAIIVGIGIWFSGAGYGFAFFLGCVCLPLILFLGNTIVGIPLLWVTWAIIIFAASGYVRFIYQLNKVGNPNWRNILPHPLFVFTGILLIFGTVMNYTPYLPWSFDEFSTWGSWAKQIFVADTFWREDMVNIYRTYPKGWPMVVAFAQFPFTTYEEYRGIALLGLFHIAVLALFYDVIRLILERDSNCSQTASSFISWTIILLLVSAEASWKLLPPSLLIERPVMYWSLGLFAVSLLAWNSEKYQPFVLFGIGLTLASALTLKTPTSSLAIPVSIIGFVYWKRQIKLGTLASSTLSLARIMIYLFLPFLITAGLWIAHSTNDKVPIGFEIYFDQEIFDRFLSLTLLLKNAFVEYLSLYKPPLTGFGLIGLISAFWFPQQRVVAIALLTYVAIGWLGIWPLYMFNIFGNEVEPLPSFQRYVRLPLRMIHYFGLAFLAVNLFHFFQSKNLAFIKLLFKEKIMIGVCSFAIIFLISFQLWTVKQSYLDMGLRVFGSTTTDLMRADNIRKFRIQSESLKKIIRTLNLSIPEILLISQGGDGFAQRMARYFSIGNLRNDNLHIYRVSKRWSWGKEKKNQWMQKISDENFRKIISQAKLVWPYNLDPWSTNILSSLIDDKNCRRKLTNYFLVKINNKFQCFAVLKR